MDNKIKVLGWDKGITFYNVEGISDNIDYPTIQVIIDQLISFKDQGYDGLKTTFIGDNQFKLTPYYTRPLTPDEKLAVENHGKLQ